MASPDPALALSASETEQVRDIRSRLNRRAVSDAALSALGTAFFQTCVRVDIGASDPIPVENLSAPLVIKAAATADITTGGSITKPPICAVLCPSVPSAHRSGATPRA